MWFGHVVPLLQFPVADRRSPVHSPIEEERTLPLPMDLCAGIATESSTALYVTYGINVDPEKWGHDLAGWFVIAPFPPTLFGTNRLIHLGVRLCNHPGAFHKAVAEPVAASNGFFLAMEVMATGDMGALVLMPEEKQRDFDTQLDTLLKKTKKDKTLEAIEERKWLGEKPDHEQPSLSRHQLKDWTKKLFANSGIDWEPARRVLVRDRQITIPYGDFWYRYRRDRKRDKKHFKKIIPPTYCLVARDMDTPVLLVLVPSRPLFRINMDIAVQSKDDSARIGVLNEVVKLLDDNNINIWHSQHTFRSLAFISDRHVSDTVAKGEEKLRAMESRFSIVASVPEKRQHDSPEAIKSYLTDLGQRFKRLRREPDSGTLKEIKESLDSMPKVIAEEFEALFNKRKEDWENFDIGTTGVKRVLQRMTDKHLQKILDNVIEPSFVRNVEMHSPPLFRCFFSHSAQPAHDERDHIEELKCILESEVFEVMEGEFSFGMSTEELSRAQIRQCNLLVSFLWPREEYFTRDGKCLPPEWITHEESFAMGQGVPVYRIIEETVEIPRYEPDRIPFKFKKGDKNSWENLKHLFQLELREFLLKILLGVNPQRSS